MLEDFDLMQPFPIPEKMGNEESKFVAAIIVQQRKFAIASGKLSTAINKYKRFTGELPPLKYYKY